MNGASSSSNNGDSQQIPAFEEIYRQEVDRVYRYLYFRLGNVEDAQDITTQTFMSAWQEFPNFRGDSKVSTWLLGIARHKLSDYFRSRHFVQQKQNIDIDRLSAQPDAAQLPMDMILQQLELEKIADTLRLLSQERADALSLRLFAGMNIAETAKLLNKSEAAVKMLIHRGLDELKWRIRNNA